MHVLELSDQDTHVLRAAVETRLREMRDELARQESPTLRSEMQRLEGIGRLIGATVDSENALF